MEIVAPVPGLVASVPIVAGAAVAAGDVVVILQSMKTEIPVSSEYAGTVAAVLVEEGQEVDIGEVLVRLR